MAYFFTVNVEALKERYTQILINDHEELMFLVHFVQRCFKIELARTEGSSLFTQYTIN